MVYLTPGELEVMKILWEHGSLKPAEILEKGDRRRQGIGASAECERRHGKNGSEDLQWGASAISRVSGCVTDISIRLHPCSTTISRVVSNVAVDTRTV